MKKYILVILITLFINQLFAVGGFGLYGDYDLMSHTGSNNSFDAGLLQLNADPFDNAYGGGFYLYIDALPFIDVEVNAEIAGNTTTTTFLLNENLLCDPIPCENQIFSTKRAGAIEFYGEITGKIDDTNVSILSNITNVRLRKRKAIKLNYSEGLTINFGNGFYHPNDGYNKASGGILTTTGFKVDGDIVNTYFFDDDGSGVIRRYSVNTSGVRVFADQAAGTIDYTNGKISIDAIKFTSSVNNDTSIDFTIMPVSDDVVAIRGSLIDISVDDIKVTGEVDTISSGESSAGVGYNSTSSSSY